MKTGKGSYKQWALVALMLVTLLAPAGAQDTRTGKDDFEATDAAAKRRQEMSGLLEEIRSDRTFPEAIGAYEALAQDLEQIPAKARELAEQGDRDWRVLALELASDSYEALASRLLQSGRSTAELQVKVERVVKLFRELEAEDEQARADLGEELAREQAELAALRREGRDLARAYQENPTPLLRAKLGALRQKLSAYESRYRVKGLFGPLQKRLGDVLRQRRSDFQFVGMSLEAVQESFLAYAEGMLSTADSLDRMGRMVEPLTLTGPDQMEILNSPELGRLGEVSGITVGRLEELINAVQGITDDGTDGERQGPVDESLDDWIRDMADDEKPVQEVPPAPPLVAAPEAAPAAEQPEQPRPETGSFFFPSAEERGDR